MLVRVEGCRGVSRGVEGCRGCRGVERVSSCVARGVERCRASVWPARGWRGAILNSRTAVTNETILASPLALPTAHCSTVEHMSAGCAHRLCGGLNPQHRQRVFWAGSSNSSTLPTRSVRNVSPNPTERESLGGVPHCRRFRPLSRQEPWRPFGQRYGRRRHAYPSPSRRTASMLDPNSHRQPRRLHSHPRRRQRTRRRQLGTTGVK